MSKAVDGHNVRLSKALSSTLRHNAEKEGIPIRDDGFVELSDLLAHQKFRNYTLEDIQQVVAQNDKQRFTLVHVEGAPTGKLDSWLIRANQGHSLKLDNVQMEEITDASRYPMVIHGTYRDKWPSIAFQGLSRMRRNHIHLAPGMPGEDGVISGMRRSCDVFIHIDMAKAIADGIPFFISSNSVILTPGKDGYLPSVYFQKVLTREGSSLL
ncbi:hypothetical protein BZG36_00334 [Bifiguratus adelaidae]|uniref:2'-phosphotransferase n=1 Tax=Bifiguratus adelaidae TaxID=1938954 RepID=A0A261Y7R8_9FUNG|nr:hypothetical protein BZG36_00334 [Bifiguratus adelaidae]